MPENADQLLARGGGNAAAAGMEFQANVAAYFALGLLSERQIDTRLGLADAKALTVRCETEAPVDDILVETSLGGYVFVQAKTSLDLSTQLKSAIGSAVEQAVRLWIACTEGNGKRRWERRLDPTKDRIVFAVGPATSNSITEGLAGALQRRRDRTSGVPIAAQRVALERFIELVRAAWKQVAGREPTASEVDELTRLIWVLQFDFSGPDKVASTEIMRHVLQDGSSAEASLAVLQQAFLRLMTARRGVDAAELRTVLVSLGVNMKAPPSYLTDIRALEAYSDRIRSHLENYEKTAVHEYEAKIARRCTDAVLLAAEQDSLLLVGEPGAGKSAVISAAAACLRGLGKRVIELAVDRLPIVSLDGLRIELELANSLVSVLRNWPGDGPAFLFIDALDATRGGQSEAVFRALIAQVLEIPGKRWRIVASIRSFDLRMGERFKELFAGKPPNSEFAELTFNNVRHINIPLWTNDELKQLEEQIPPIKTALASGGPRLRELAAVPFNTRLLADLLGNGVSAEAFGEIKTQVELLGLYWSNRVTEYGPSVELCLRDAVTQMVAIRGLRADRLGVAQVSPTGLESLMAESVLVPVAGNRYVAFRHHILFDYAASRVYLSATDIDATAALLTRERGLGLMLGPALVFALQDVWSLEETGSTSFWKAVVRLVSDGECDPVIRSVAARTACELPKIGTDFDGLVSLLRSPQSSVLAAKTIPHMVGSLSVRVEDKASIPVPAWCYFAERLSEFVAVAAWPLRTLLFLLLGKQATEEQENQLGLASRRLLTHGLAEQNAAALVNAAIGFVGDTFGTNPEESRALLGRLFESQRFEKHGHEDIPWLTRKVTRIAQFDREFVVSIYAHVFAGAITDQTETSLGHSRILPLISNRRQDYEMAQWTLAEYFPKFLEQYPGEAAVALVEAIKGYVDREHPIRDGARRFTIYVGNQSVELIEDWSYIWASDPEQQHGDNALSLLVAFVKRMADAPAADIVEVANALISRNALAIVWARLMLVGVRRIEVLGKILWPFASRREFLVLSDTTKDSVDLVSKEYPRQTKAARAEFEREVLKITFPEASKPEDLRRYMRRRILGTIGSDQLVTSEAKEALSQATSDFEDVVENERPFRSGGVYRRDVEDNWWLKEQGVDTAVPTNADLIGKTEALKKDFASNKGEFAVKDFGATLRQLEEFLMEVDRAAEAHPRVRSQAIGVFGEALNKLVASDETAAVSDDSRIARIVAMIKRLANDESPELSENTEANFEQSVSWGSPAPRVDAAEIALVLSRASASALGQLKDTIVELLGDPHPAVRMSVANRINAIWETDRPFMWELANRVVSNELNVGVLGVFANLVLGTLLWAAPDEVERLTLALLKRDEQGARKGHLSEQIGAIVGLLWIGRGLERSRDLVRSWLRDVEGNQEYIEHAVSILRGNVVAGYDKPEPRAIAARKRAHQLAEWAVDATAANLQTYFNLPNRTQESEKRIVSSAKILNHVGNQFYFSSGAFRHRNGDEDHGLENVDNKREFLNELEPILRRIADVATPGTLHHLVELFEFLIPADPPRVFDLVAHALLGSGKTQGYHLESLGADRVVAVVGRFLADYREVFEDEVRRSKLVECLDAFIDAGWPSARRLLYRLPELLQ
jgi:hypothetical protein